MRTQQSCRCASLHSEIAHIHRQQYCYRPSTHARPGLCLSADQHGTQCQCDYATDRPGCYTQQVCSSGLRARDTALRLRPAQLSRSERDPRAAPQVTDQGAAVGNLNELEAIDGEIWANVWMTDCIARIDPQSGAVKCVAAPAPFKFPRTTVLLT